MDWSPTKQWVAYSRDECTQLLQLLRYHINRCRSLDFTLPDNFWMSADIFKAFGASASSLIELHLRNFRGLTKQNLPWSDLPKLENLTLDSGYAMKDMATSISLKSLTTLNINLDGFDMQTWDVGSDWKTTIFLLQSLISLDIRNSQSKLPNSLPDTRIVLPLLQRLGVWGVREIQSVHFEVPMLQTLYFDSEVSNTCDSSLVCPPEVVWRPKTAESFVKAQSLAVKRAFLKSVILNHSSSTRFVVPDWAGQELLASLIEMKSDGIAPRSPIEFMTEGETRVHELDLQGFTGE